MLSGQWHIWARLFVRAKDEIWSYMLTHPEGCTVLDIASNTSCGPQMVSACLEELFLEDRIFMRHGRFYPESDC
jgi:hypothetical protein